METLHVIRNTVIVILIFTLGVYAQENNGNYFKLYKDGQKIKKQEVYVKLNQNFKKSQTSDKETFIYKNKFVFTNTGQKCQQQDKIVFSNVEDLYAIEKKVLDQYILNTEKEHGFKPIYPLNHVALKVLLIIDSDCFVLDWKRL